MLAGHLLTFTLESGKSLDGPGPENATTGFMTVRLWSASARSCERFGSTGAKTDSRAEASHDSYTVVARQDTLLLPPCPHSHSGHARRAEQRAHGSCAPASAEVHQPDRRDLRTPHSPSSPWSGIRRRGRSISLGFRPSAARGHIAGCQPATRGRCAAWGVSCG